jgi:hypothetical protein
MRFWFALVFDWGEGSLTASPQTPPDLQCVFEACAPISSPGLKPGSSMGTNARAPFLVGGSQLQRTKPASLPNRSDQPMRIVPSMLMATCHLTKKVVTPFQRNYSRTHCLDERPQPARIRRPRIPKHVFIKD